jgi:hypothetical protein
MSSNTEKATNPGRRDMEFGIISKTVGVDIKRRTSGIPTAISFSFSARSPCVKNYTTICQNQRRSKSR